VTKTHAAILARHVAGKAAARRLALKMHYGDSQVERSATQLDRDGSKAPRSHNEPEKPRERNDHELRK
jgi:hypothetical protein